MSDKKLTIAIDGFSSCGKSTVAKELARKLGYVYVDTGAMYRAVTLYCMRHNLIADDGTVDEAALKSQIEKIGISFIYDQATGKNTTLLNGEVVEDEIRRIEELNGIADEVLDSQVQALIAAYETFVAAQNIDIGGHGEV